MTEICDESGAADTGDGLRLDGRAAGAAGGVAAITPEQAELIRFQHHRLGTSVKMIAAIMRLSQARVKAVLKEAPSIPAPPPPSPPPRRKAAGSCVRPALAAPAVEPSEPTEPDVQARTRRGNTGPRRGNHAKVPTTAPHATPRGYVPIMSDAHRRRPA